MIFVTLLVFVVGFYFNAIDPLLLLAACSLSQTGIAYSLTRNLGNIFLGLALLLLTGALYFVFPVLLEFILGSKIHESVTVDFNLHFARISTYTLALCAYAYSTLDGLVCAPSSELPTNVT